MKYAKEGRMNEHLERNVVVRSKGGMEIIPAFCAESSPQWDVLAPLWDELAKRGVIEVEVGPTGYLDQVRDGDVDVVEPLTAVCDRHGRKGIAVRLYRTSDRDARFIEVLFQRYTHPGPVVSGSWGGRKLIVLSTFDSEAQQRFSALRNGTAVKDPYEGWWALG